VYGKKYWTPQLLYIEAINHVKQQKDSIAITTLAYIEANYAGTDIAKKATTLKDVVSKRKEIEAYLINSKITKDEEQKLNAPYEEAPQIELITGSYVIPPMPPPALSVLPKQAISLEKPMPGIEIMLHTYEKKEIKPDLTLTKKAGTDPIYIRPHKEVFVDMVYVYNTSEPYYFLFIFENIDPVYRSEAKIAFQRFNGKARGGEDISTQLHEPKDGASWLEIGPFPAMASSLGYYDEVAASINSFIPWLSSDKYQMLIISEKNIEILKSRRDVSEYLLFIRQYIKAKF
jgi:hypothetical protein